MSFRRTHAHNKIPFFVSQCSRLEHNAINGAHLYHIPCFSLVRNGDDAEMPFKFTTIEFARYLIFIKNKHSL